MTSIFQSFCTYLLCEGKQDMEEAVRSSEEQFRNLAEQLPVMIFIYCRGRIEYANTALQQGIGYTCDDLYAPDFSFDATQPPDSAEIMHNRLKTQMSDVKLPPCELELVTKDDRKIDVMFFSQQIDYEGDKAILGSFIDVTDRKKVERQNIRQQVRLRELTNKLVTAQEKEQRRIAEGLHDDVAQLLVACSVHCKLASECTHASDVKGILGKIDALLLESIDKVRSLSFELGSATLCRVGLREAISELCERMTQLYGIGFYLHCGNIRIDIDDLCAIILFKSVRELLFNVVKHADVREATVTISVENNLLIVSVQENGRGFPDTCGDHGPSTEHGLGLFAIKERLRDIGGTIQIRSEPNVSTQVRLCVPVRNNKGQ